MSTAIRNTKIRKNMMEAHRWLRDQGYDCIRGHWMKDRSFAGFYAAYKARSAWVDYAATCAIGDLLLKEMDNIQAPNNIEVTFTDSEGKATATVTVCRVSGKSPAQQLHEVKQERDALLAGLEEIAACAPFNLLSADSMARATIAKAKGGAA